MFDIDDMADKDLFEETSGNPSEEPQTDPVPPTEDPTKAYSERLKKDREKIRIEEREALAKEFGYDSYEKFRDAHVDNSLLDKGLDPDTVKPLINMLKQCASKPKKKTLKKTFGRKMKSKNSTTNLD